MYRIELWEREYISPSQAQAHTSLDFRSMLGPERIVSPTDLLKIEAKLTGTPISIQEVHDLNERISKVGKSIGNIKSTSSSLNTNWDVNKILGRTKTLLERLIKFGNLLFRIILKTSGSKIRATLLD